MSKELESKIESLEKINTELMYRIMNAEEQVKILKDVIEASKAEMLQSEILTAWDNKLNKSL